MTYATPLSWLQPVMLWVGWIAYFLVAVVAIAWSGLRVRLHRGPALLSLAGGVVVLLGGGAFILWSAVLRRMLLFLPPMALQAIGTLLLIVVLLAMLLPAVGAVLGRRSPSGEVAP